MKYVVKLKEGKGRHTKRIFKKERKRGYNKRNRQ
jgi:hypothetical protein